MYLKPYSAIIVKKVVVIVTFKVARLTTMCVMSRFPKLQ